MSSGDVEVVKLSKAFGNLLALSDVSMVAKKGRITALLGDNGAGKSTLIKVLRGVMQPTSGEIRIGGEKKVLKSPIDAIKEGIQCVYQDSTLIEDLTVAENFCMGEEITKRYLGGLLDFVDFEKEREVAKTFLAKMGFHYDVTRQVKFTSGGERRALAVARAFFYKPKILLLDEPLIALSEHAKSRMFELLEEIKKTCVTIHVTHQVEVALETSDDIVVLKTGKVTYKGPASSVTHKQCLKYY